MTQLSLPTSTINKIIDDPSILGLRVNGPQSQSNSTSDSLASLGITPSDADFILHGYTSGFRTVFILNACLSAFATIVSILMIKQQELTRPDEERLKAEAKAWSERRRDSEKGEKRRSTEDMEMTSRAQSVAGPADIEKGEDVGSMIMLSESELTCFVEEIKEFFSKPHELDHRRIPTLTPYKAVL